MSGTTTQANTNLVTYFRIGGDPVGCFTVVIAFLDPAFEPFTLDGVVPTLPTLETGMDKSNFQTMERGTEIEMKALISDFSRGIFFLNGDLS